MAHKNGNQRTNKLFREKSPYLLQHAHNPVDWYPWTDEAFERAERENKPIFLSIGYSTCHWCHVMERESFEDEEVARLLNEHFISIKVDREERPDVDHIYMSVCQSMTGHGGWPLTILMTPTKKPFFAGTYFPKDDQYGRSGLLNILNQVRLQWHANRDHIEQVGNEIADTLSVELQSSSEGELDESVFHDAFKMLSQVFDGMYGGFGQAPKFPTPHYLGFLLRYWKDTGNGEALAMVEKSLHGMYSGGIYDHIGYGFSRYSTDREWLVPHFEKMLYDNALLAYTFLEAYQAVGRDSYAQVAREIFAYVLRDMTAVEGGFYSAEDADSEGEEGKFYVWTPQQIEEVLGDKEWTQAICEWYGVSQKGNFEGKNILNRIHQTPVPNDRDSESWEQRLTHSRAALFAAREQRVHPHKDDKILTGWNGLMIAALARGAVVFNESSYLDAAVRAAEFIWSHLRSPKGRLLARYRDGEAAHLGYLDDYAYMIWALLELYQADMRPLWLERAILLQEEQNRLFWDSSQGGYFFYGTDAEQLLARPKEIYDGATPSGNSVSALNLLKLTQLTGEQSFGDQARQTLESFFGDVAQYPPGHTHYLMALMLALRPSREVVVASLAEGSNLRDQLSPLHRTFAPDTVFLYRFPADEDDKLVQIAPYTSQMQAMEGKTTYYVCHNFSCDQPTTERKDVEKVLVGKPDVFDRSHDD